MNDEIILKRNCEAVLIPAGTKVTLQAGEPVDDHPGAGRQLTPLLSTATWPASKRAMPTPLARRRPQRPTPPIQTRRPSDGKVNEEQVLEQLRTCYDPEIPVNIVDLGLVYDLQILPLPDGGNRVEVKMTLTAPGCGMGPVLQQDVETKVSAIPGVKEAAVFLVWDPPWNRDMLSEAAKLQLGMM